MAHAVEELRFLFYLIAINCDFNNRLWLAATVQDSSGLE